MRDQIRRRRSSDAALGMTLIELLVTIMIIGLMTSMVLFSMQIAQESARAARTKALIASLHSLIMEKYEAYQGRRLPLTYSEFTNWPSTKDAARNRLEALRKLMQAELPDRFTDIPAIGSQPVRYQNDLWRAYRNALEQAPNRSVYNQGAECLYLIVTMSLNEGEKRYFNDTDIGDVDKDGLFEILDGWGKPISFLRWPNGFIPANGAITQLQTGNPTVDHDSFDHFLCEPDSYRTVPLIYSAGPDGEFGIVADNRRVMPDGSPDPSYTEFSYADRSWPTNPAPPAMVGTMSTMDIYSRSNTPSLLMGTPYTPTPTGVSPPIPFARDSIDNLHNHLIEAR